MIRDTDQLPKISWSYILSVITVIGLGVLVSQVINFEALEKLDFSVVWQYRYTFVRGTLVTLGIAAFAVVFGLLVGAVLAIFIIAGPVPVRWLVIAYVEIWRNTPLIVQLFWVHFALPMLTGIQTTTIQSGVLAITLQSSAYLTDIVYTGVLSVAKGQYEAADALGLPRWSRWIDIILPQALRIVVPPLATIAIGYFKGTAILALLSVNELLYQADAVAAYTQRPIEVMTVAALIYWALGSLFGALTYRLESVLKWD